MKVVSLVVFLALFVSCKNYEKIDSLKKQIADIDNKVQGYQNQVNDDKTKVQSLTSEKDRQFSISSSLTDQTKNFAKEYPMASAYIYEFDKMPIDILREYIEAKNDDERNGLLFSHIFLLGYYNMGHNSDTVSYARSVLSELDEKKKQCLITVDSLKDRIKSYEAEILSGESNVALLQPLRDSLTSELKKETE